MDVKAQRISTGIDDLDKILDGGLEKKNSYLIAGESGSGKTVFCLQCMYSALKKGKGVIYVAIHETPREIIDDAKSFGWDIKKYIKNKKLIMLDMSPFISKVNEGETLSVRRMMADLTKSVHTNNAKLIILDSIDFIARHVTKSERDIGEYIREIILGISHNLGCTAVITSNMYANKKDLSESGMEGRIVTGIIILGTTNNRTDRIMQIIKMRQTHVDLSKYLFDIIPKKGIVVTGKLLEGGAEPGKKKKG